MDGKFNKVLKERTHYICRGEWSKLLSYPKDGGSIFLRNVNKNLKDYTMSHST
jgi:hypothetical protein